MVCWISWETLPSQIVQQIKLNPVFMYAANGVSREPLPVYVPHLGKTAPAPTGTTRQKQQQQQQEQQHGSNNSGASYANINFGKYMPRCVGK